MSVHHEYFVGTFASILLCTPTPTPTPTNDTYVISYNDFAKLSFFILKGSYNLEQQNSYTKFHGYNIQLISLPYTYIFSARNIISSPIQKLIKALTKRNVNHCNNYSYGDCKKQATHALYWHLRDVRSFSTLTISMQPIIP